MYSIQDTLYFIGEKKLSILNFIRFSNEYNLNFSKTSMDRWYPIYQSIGAYEDSKLTLNFKTKFINMSIFRRNNHIEGSHIEGNGFNSKVINVIRQELYPS